MSYYEFITQIYAGEESAQELYEVVKNFMEDKQYKFARSVLWEVERRVVKT